MFEEEEKTKKKKSLFLYLEVFVYFKKVVHWLPVNDFPSYYGMEQRNMPTLRPVKLLKCVAYAAVPLPYHDRNQDTEEVLT